jgi:hypothetical protein
MALIRVVRHVCLFEQRRGEEVYDENEGTRMIRQRVCACKQQTANSGQSPCMVNGRGRASSKEVKRPRDAMMIDIKSEHSQGAYAMSKE